MKKTIPLFALLFALAACEDTYRYPCQDPANKDNPKCNRPICEADRMCYDILNGLPPKQTTVEETTVVVEEGPAAATEVVEEHVVVESTGE
jgi:hypothetical protein